MNIPNFVVKCCDEDDMDRWSYTERVNEMSTTH